MGFETGIALPYAAAPVEQDALANLRPIQLGANPIQIQGMAPWQVPETKPYVAQGIAKAMENIGAGIKARYEEKKADKKEEAKSKFETDKLAEQIRHNKALEKSTQSRIDAVSSGKLKQLFDEEDPMEVGDGKDSEASSAVESPISAKYTPPAPQSSQGSSNALALALPVKSSAPKIKLAGDTTSDPIVTLNRVGSDGDTMSLSAAPVKISGVAPAAPVAAPMVAPVAVAKPEEMTPDEQAAEKAQKDQFLKSVGQLGGIPSAKKEEPKAKQDSTQSNPLTLGTDKGEKDTSQEDAVKEAAKNPPALINVEAPSLDVGTVNKDGSPKPALSDIPSIQSVNPKDFRYRFGDKPNMANVQAVRFNEKYPFAAVQAEVKEPSKNVPYWHVEYKDVADKRRSEAANQEIKRERLNNAKDAKITAMATAFNNHPKSKLMDLRKDAMERMLVAVKNHYAAKEDPTAESLPFIHQEMMDLFAQFASGKAPTEAQFHEAKSAFAGLAQFQSISKKFQHWYSGATLDDRDVNTILNLMVDTYNNSADQTNAKLSNIGNMLKDEHPDIKPYKMPVPYPLLKTTEQLREQLGEKNLDNAESEYQKLKGEYIDEVNKSFKKEMPLDKQKRFLKLEPIVSDYIALKANKGIPPNANDLKHFKKKVYGDKEFFEIPGFHSSYFGPRDTLREINPTGGHYYGTPE